MAWPAERQAATQVLSILDGTAATWPNVTQAVLDLDYLASAACTRWEGGNPPARRLRCQLPNE